MAITSNHPLLRMQPKLPTWQLKIPDLHGNSGNIYRLCLLNIEGSRCFSFPFFGWVFFCAAPRNAWFFFQGTPSVVSFNSAITACERASAWNIGLHLLQVGVDDLDKRWSDGCKLEVFSPRKLIGDQWLLQYQIGSCWLVSCITKVRGMWVYPNTYSICL